MVLVGTRYSTPPPPTHPHYPGYTSSPHAASGYTAARSSRGVNMVVGLYSVEQLSLSVHFSGLLGITEVYNLGLAGRIINHFHIPGTK